MRTRVSVTIAGENYTMVGEQNEDYIRKVAAIVDKKVNEIKDRPGISTMQAMALASCDIADEYLKAVEAADNLRAQMKNYLEEAELLRYELEDVNKELAQYKK